MSLEDDLFEQRAARVREIEALGYRPFGQRFDFTITIPEVLRDFSEKTAEDLVPQVRARVAGRIQTVRRMGKAGFMHIQQNGARLQLYVRQDAVESRSAITVCSDSWTSATLWARKDIFFARAPAN